MATVTHPSSERSPTTSGLDQTTAAQPPTEWWPIRRAAPSRVIRGPLGGRVGRSHKDPPQRFPCAAQE
eukprot:4585875-Alexandrium_andersonii.AAC.1